MRNRHQYPDEWFDVIRPEILKRDRFKCQKCGLVHKSTGYYGPHKQFIVVDSFQKEWALKHGFKVQKISLQIAHLDQDKNNNDYSNLQTLCPKCHLAFDRPFNTVKRLMSRSDKKNF